MNVVTERQVIKFLNEKIVPGVEIPATIPFVQSGVLDSLQLVNMIFELEKYFNVKFNLANLDLKLIESPIAIADTINNLRGVGDYTLRTLIDTICTENSVKNAILFDTELINYNQLLNHIKSISASFLKMGIGKGTKVAILLNNRIEYIYSYFALFYVGALPVPINNRWKSGEIENILRDCQAKVLITEELVGTMAPHEVVNEIEGHDYKLDKIIYMGENHYGHKGLCFDELLKSDFDGLENLEEINANDDAMISYTSGTTGMPKGVVLKNNDIVKISLYSTKLWSEDVDRPFSIAPLYSAQGFLSLLINFCTEERFKMISSFNPNDILREVSKAEDTILHTQPTMWTLLLNCRIINFTKFSGLKKLVVSGSLCSPELAQRIEEKLNCELLNAYGLIEGTSVVTMTRIGDPLDVRMNTVGRAIPGVEIKIVDQNTRKSVPHGEIGELAVRGYNMREYYNQPEKTAAVIDDEGWLYTGDLARYYDRENISIVGRCKDMIIRGGFNVYPSDIEEKILQIPNVQTVAVVGREHEVLGEEIIAFIVPVAGKSIEKSEITQYLFKNLSNYKQPDKIEFISEMPIILAGKIDKKLLKEWCIEGIPEDKRVLYKENK